MYITLQVVSLLVVWIKVVSMWLGWGRNRRVTLLLKHYAVTLLVYR